MKLGITMFATDYAMRPDDLAQACEERGFESVWFPEHTHIPASLRTPPPVGTKVPRYLYHLHDLFGQTMLAYLPFQCWRRRPQTGGAEDQNNPNIPQQ